MALGVPAAVERSEDECRRWLAPLAPRATGPALVVVPVPAETALPLATPTRGTAFVDLRPRVSADFPPLPELEVREAEPYLVADVDTGADLQDVTPEDALGRIRAAGRSPLTIAEGVALLLQQPDVLE